MCVKATVLGLAGKVALAVLTNPEALIITVVPAGKKLTCPHTSQSPAVREIEVTLAAVAVVRETAEPLATEAVRTSPTLPAFALSAAVVPLMPLVVEGVIRPVALRVVKAPVLAVVAPIALLLIPPTKVIDPFAWLIEIGQSVNTPAVYRHTL